MLKIVQRFIGTSSLRWCSTISSQQIDLEKSNQIIEEISAFAGVPISNCQNTYSLFKNYGFQNEDILMLLKSNKSLLIRPTENLITSLELWRGFQFGDKYFQDLIKSHPEFLDVNNHQTIANRITYLTQYFKNPRNVWRLLLNSPTVIIDKENNIKDSFNYLIDRMRIEIPEIVRSSVFTKSLDNLKCRHIFLERLGLFKPRSLKSTSKEPSKNPKLYQIIDTTDEEFCAKTCGVTLIEFETFVELLEKERIDKELKENEVDEDSDDDDDYEVLDEKI